MEKRRIARILFNMSLGLDYADGIECAEKEIEYITKELNLLKETNCDALLNTLENIALQNEKLEFWKEEIHGEEKRKVLFTNGMSSEFMIIITDAPKTEIEKWCYRYNESVENGTYGKEVDLFDSLKAMYYVRELVDSEVDDIEDAKIIGYDEEYDLACYYVEG